MGFSGSSTKKLSNTKLSNIQGIHSGVKGVSFEGKDLQHPSPRAKDQDCVHSDVKVQVTANWLQTEFSFH